MRELDVDAGSGRRRLMTLGGILVPLGLLVIVLGWFGAARTPNEFEQIPYLISGGLLGLALVFLGGFLYFAHWLTRMVHEQRSASAAVVDAVNRLAASLEQEVVERSSAGPPVAVDTSGAPGNGNGRPRPAKGAPAPPADLVVTLSGTLAHRRTCRVVAGKPGVRPVEAADDLAPCRLCHPYG